MDALGEIEIKVEGRVGAEELSPALVDIDEIRDVLSQAGDLLFPGVRRSQRPRISYEIQEGCVSHRFRTVMQTVIGFGAVLAQVEAEGQIDFLHERSAAAIESLQRLAVEKDYVVTLRANDSGLRIDRNTHYERDEAIWVDAEFYLYGELVDAGGKSSPNIHLDTEEFGVLRIAAEKDFLKNAEENLLYRRFGVRVQGRQNLGTFEMDRNSLTFLELLDYDAEYAESYLDGLLKKAAPAWESVPNADDWLAELRGTTHG
jgi:hypothetical protein